MHCSSVHDQPSPFIMYFRFLFSLGPTVTVHSSRRARSSHFLRALDLYSIAEGFRSHCPFVSPSSHMIKGLPFVWYLLSHRSSSGPHILHFIHASCPVALDLLSVSYCPFSYLLVCSFPFVYL